MSDNENKIIFYKQQWTEVYNLDTLDWRIALILLPSVGAFLAVIEYITSIQANVVFMFEGVRAFLLFSFF